jgi:hypothetical protein
MQRPVPPSWRKGKRTTDHPRLLVEDDDPALAVSDFSLFRKAGFEVALCRGPGYTAEGCPLLHGEECHLLTSADVVLHGLDPHLGVRAIINETKPTLGVVTIARHSSGPPIGHHRPPQRVSLRGSASVDSQIDALRRAIRKPLQPEAPGD